MKLDRNGSHRRRRTPTCRLHHEAAAFLRCYAVNGFLLKAVRLFSTTYLIILVSPYLNGTLTRAQAPDTGWEDRPKLMADIGLLPRTRIQAWGELQHGLNFSFQRWRTGFLVNRLMKPIL